MSQNPFLSIIIPVYKVEKYIYACLNSIFEQDFNECNYEVIVVNDGTPDNSMEIVQQFAGVHLNITVINQENQGLSCARNAGLKVAQGEYIWFVDSDDTLDFQSLERLFGILKSNTSDILGFNLLQKDEVSGKGGIQKIVLSNNNYSLYGKSVTCLDILHKTHNAPVQRFVFSHKFLTENNLWFYPGIIHEDVEFMTKAFVWANSITFYDQYLYRYLLRSSGSIMSSLNMRSLNDKWTIVESIADFKNNNSFTRNKKLYLDDCIIQLIYNITRQSKNYPSSEVKDYFLIHKNDIKSFAWYGIKSSILLGNAGSLVKAVNLWMFSKLMF